MPPEFEQIPRLLEVYVACAILDSRRIRREGRDIASIRGAAGRRASKTDESISRIESGPRVANCRGHSVLWLTKPVRHGLS